MPPAYSNQDSTNLSEAPPPSYRSKSSGFLGRSIGGAKVATTSTTATATTRVSSSARTEKTGNTIVGKSSYDGSVPEKSTTLTLQPNSTKMEQHPVRSSSAATTATTLWKRATMKMKIPTSLSKHRSIRMSDMTSSARETYVTYVPRIHKVQLNQQDNVDMLNERLEALEARTVERKRRMAQMEKEKEQKQKQENEDDNENGDDNNGDDGDDDDIIESNDDDIIDNKSMEPSQSTEMTAE
eukprot:CAMPEP_0202443882 /NCGR_PEP_ID=MMETSP1360-20130828/3055_1 /ASSEMBLY_ACC=CAM_ASM_000848 /TAXON_ID=515479 /ORGANISM="Licmophora paradoxa, Strain CCMP2313" /LENGTH=239 /DNA_ID=CAMNT_0049059709 /DNA_START=68 /DNA_END=787 /DNA_ORIENTATION=+